MTENAEIKIIFEDDISGIKALTDDIIECMEIIDDFSLDGRYIDCDFKNERMAKEEAQNFKMCYYSLFLVAKPQKLSVRKLLEWLKPMQKFIVGIYRNGQLPSRFENRRIDESASDKFLLNQFAVALKEKLTEFAKQQTPHSD